jgi:hypothetical protein
MQSSGEVLYGSGRVLPQYQLDFVPMINSVKSSNPDMYIPQYGLFATQDIDAGTRIISEGPLITLPTHGNHVMKLVDAFDELKPYQQQKIRCINPASSTAFPLLTALAGKIHENLALLVKFIEKNNHRCTKELKTFLDEYWRGIGKVFDMSPLAARWHSANYPLAQPATNTPVSGLFIETAHLRHSCIPNCHANYNPNTNLMTVQTTHAISAGDELTLPTITGVYYHTASMRAAELKSRFGFTCTCAACDPSSPQFVLHESLRLQIYVRTLHLEHFLDLVDIVFYQSGTCDSCLCASGMHTHPEPPTLEDLRNAENTILTLIENLKATGCEGPELIRWYNALIDRIHPLAADALDTDEERARWGRVVLRHANECVKLGFKCFGEGSDEVNRSSRQVERVERAIADAETRMELVKAGKKTLGEMVKSMETDTEKKVGWEVVGVTGEEKEVMNKDGTVVVKIRTYKPVQK